MVPLQWLQREKSHGGGREERPLILRPSNYRLPMVRLPLLLPISCIGSTLTFKNYPRKTIVRKKKIFRSAHDRILRNRLHCQFDALSRIPTETTRSGDWTREHTRTQGNALTFTVRNLSSDIEDAQFRIFSTPHVLPVSVSENSSVDWESNTRIELSRYGSHREG